MTTSSLFGVAALCLIAMWHRPLGEEAKTINQNAERSPKWEYLRQQGIEEEYRFKLSREEAENLRSQIVTFSEIKYLPYVYTRKGCAYFGTSMNNPAACAQAVQLTEAFDTVQDLKSLSTSDRNFALMELYLAEMRADRDRANLQEKRLWELTKAAASTDQRVLQVETSHNLVGNYYAVKGYASKKGIPVSEPLAAKIGKSASKYSRENDIHISKTTHHLYGEINTYHEDALAAVWPNYFEEED